MGLPVANAFTAQCIHCSAADGLMMQMETTGLISACIVLEISLLDRGCVEASPVRSSLCFCHFYLYLPVRPLGDEVQAVRQGHSIQSRPDAAARIIHVAEVM